MTLGAIIVAATRAEKFEMTQAYFYGKLFENHQILLDLNMEKLFENRQILFSKRGIIVRHTKWPAIWIIREAIFSVRLQNMDSAGHYILHCGLDIASVEIDGTKESRFPGWCIQ